MHVAPRPTQLAFDFGPGEPAAEVEAADDLAERLIAGGIVANDYLLRINRSLQNPDPVPAPSRLYRFPLEFVDRDRLVDGARSRLLLNHSRLVDFPFVRRVATVTGVEPEWDPYDEFGRERDLPRWWHAVDLTTEADWRHLMMTRHLTEDARITSAIVFALETPAHYGRGCRSGRIDVETARTILSTLDAEEPADRSDGLLCGDGIDPSHIVEKHHRTGRPLSDRWTINVRATGAAGSWLVVHGIEDGWFAGDRSGHLQLAPAGRARRSEACLPAASGIRAAGIASGLMTPPFGQLLSSTCGLRTTVFHRLPTVCWTMRLPPVGTLPALHAMADWSAPHLAAADRSAAVDA